MIGSDDGAGGLGQCSVLTRTKKENRALARI
jgi:hypothetical protein